MFFSPPFFIYFVADSPFFILHSSFKPSFFKNV